MFSFSLQSVPVNHDYRAYRIDIVLDMFWSVNNGKATGLVGPRQLEEGIWTAEEVFLVQLLAHELELDLVFAHGKLFAGNNQFAVTWKKFLKSNSIEFKKFRFIESL